MSAPLPLSVAVITLNEERNLARCLESVRGLAAEIVVVDSGSTDRTAAIAASFGARFEVVAWPGHVAQKNNALDRCTQPWVLSLDADEALSPGLRAEIERTLRDTALCERFAAFRFPRLCTFAGRWIRHGDWYPDYSTRLWRRGAAKWGGIDPHDKLEVTGAVGTLKSDLLHFAVDNIDRILGKIISYGNDFAKHAVANGTRITAFDLVFRPTWRFFRSYVVRCGFLDGWQGYNIARLTALYTYVRYAKAREAQAPPAALP